MIAINPCITFSFRNRWLPGISLLLFLYRWLPVRSVWCWHCGSDMKASSRENCLGVSLALAILAGACSASFCGGLLFCFVVYFGWQGGVTGDQAATADPRLVPSPTTTGMCLAGAPLQLSVPVPSGCGFLSIRLPFWMDYSHECFLSNRRQQTNGLLTRSHADRLRQWCILSAAAPVVAGCWVGSTDDARRLFSLWWFISMRILFGFSELLSSFHVTRPRGRCFHLLVCTNLLTVFGGLGVGSF